MEFQVQVCLGFPASDESDATRQATELTKLLVDSGYDHTSTTVIDAGGAVIAEFGYDG